MKFFTRNEILTKQFDLYFLEKKMLLACVCVRMRACMYKYDYLKFQYVFI